MSETPRTAKLIDTLYSIGIDPHAAAEVEEVVGGMERELSEANKRLEQTQKVMERLKDLDLYLGGPTVRDDGEVVFRKTALEVVEAAIAAASARGLPT